MTERATHILGTIVFPLVLLAALASMLIFSNVPPNLWVIDGTPAAIILIAYAAIVTASIFIRDRPHLHELGVIIGAIAFVGRAGGFLHLVIDHNRYDLIAAVAERAVLALAVVLWHISQAAQAALRQLTNP